MFSLLVFIPREDDITIGKLKNLSEPSRNYMNNQTINMIVVVPPGIRKGTEPRCLT